MSSLVIFRIGRTVAQWNKGASYTVHTEGQDNNYRRYATDKKAIAAARRRHAKLKGKQ